MNRAAVTSPLNLNTSGSKRVSLMDGEKDPSVVSSKNVPRCLRYSFE